MSTPVSLDPGLLHARALTKSFGGNPVLRGIDLSLAPGTITVVQGDVDSGRTTLLRCLAGTYRPTGGAVVLGHGHSAVDFAGTSSRAVAFARRTRLASYDGPLVAPPRTTALTATMRATREPEATVRRGFARLGLARMAGVTMGALRADTARRVGLVAALVHPGPVVLLDEPLTALDASAVVEWIHERRGRGDAVVLTTATGVRPDADSVAILDEGTLHWQQP
jgi:ABC-type multidrug transport system ATPase subunit